MDRIQVDYKGFTPAGASVQKFKAAFGYALGKGPSDASAKATVSQVTAGYTCEMVVHSSHGHFNFGVEAKDLDTLYDNACKKAIAEFAEWHENPDSEKFRHK